MGTNKTIKIGSKLIGEGQPCYLIAEIGINHNGSLDIAKQLIKAAHDAGWDAVKFQKRTVDLVYSKEELDRLRESPFGKTNGDLKRGLELGMDEYREIDRYCKSLGIDWFASCWDTKSVDFMEMFNPPVYKIASACLTDDELMKRHRDTGRPMIISTGMSNKKIIDEVINIFGREKTILLHCNSTYPTALEELNLKRMETLRNTYQVPVGYSGHEVGVYTSYAAAILGACIVERHITLDRAMWGSDQAASLEPPGFKRLAEDIKLIPTILGDGEIKIYESEIPVMKKLRKHLKHV